MLEYDHMSDVMNLQEQIKEAESLSKQLELTSQEFEKLQSSIQSYIQTFLQSLSNQPVFNPNNDSLLKDHEEIITTQGRSIEDLLTTVQNQIMAPGINAASGGHMGYIPGGGLVPAGMADYLAAITNRYAGIYYAAPGAVALENRLVEWMNQLMGFPKTATGNLTSGGSISILIAVVTARDALEISSKDFHNCVIYLTDQTHHALQKALRIAGLGDCHLRMIPMDDELKMIPDHLEKQILKDKASGLTPLLVNASIGTTNTGSVDPVEDLGQIANRQGVWFHVDAAYGGFFKLLESCQDYFKGIERADSIVLDPHKSLFLPFGIGAVLIKNAEAVLASHHYQASYMQDMEIEGREISPADVSPELTKHFRGLRMWLPLQYFGLDKIKAALQEKLLLANYFHSEVQKIAHIEVGPPPDLSICIFRITQGNLDDDNVLNRQLLHSIQMDGRVFLSSTLIDGVFWIRVCVLSFRTHLAHVETLLTVIKERLANLYNQIITC